MLPLCFARRGAYTPAVSNGYEERLMRLATLVALLSGVAAVVGGCESMTAPAEELWPNQPIVYTNPWVPDLFQVENIVDYATVIAIESDMVGERPVTVMRNLRTEEAITVTYIDTLESYQRVEIEPGGTLALAALPKRIISVE